MRLLPDFVTYPGSLGLFLGLCAFGGAVLWLLIGFRDSPAVAVDCADSPICGLCCRRVAGDCLGHA
jgi:hypothetical protein